MNILIINGSPKGENSITYQTIKYLETCYPEHTYHVCHAGKMIKKLEKDFTEAANELAGAELIIFAYPVYTFLVPSQLHRFIELIKEQRIDLKGKYATQVTTSKHFYDITAHAFIEENCTDLGMHVLKGLSADMEDLLSKAGQKEARAFFHRIIFEIRNGCYVRTEASKPKKEATLLKECRIGENNIKAIPDSLKGKRIVVVTDASADNNRLNSMIRCFEQTMPCETDIINIREFPFLGGCLGCFNCASDGKCIYADGFDKFLRENIQNSDAIVYAFSIKDHSMGATFKMYDDRQFCNGHRTVTMGKPIGYLVDGYYHDEKNLMTLLEARAQVGGNHLSYVATNESDAEEEIRILSCELSYDISNNYVEPQNFYGVGGMKIFRDLIYTMQGLMREDHRFYKERGFYDFPQKHTGRILAMYAVGQMMASPSISKKLGAKMTEGMLMPYKKVIEKAKKLHG